MKGMWNVRVRSIYPLLLCGFTLSALVVPPALGAEAAPPVAGEVVSVEGVVFIRPDGRDSAGGLKPARPGDPLRAGDVINTSSNGKVKLLMKDKSIVDLGPSALFKVDHFNGKGGTDREVDVSMMYGTMRTAVSQKITGGGRFKVRTPTATMGVRGTEFVVKSEVRNLNDVRNAVQGKVMQQPAASPSFANSPASPSPDGKPASPPPVARTEITVIQGKVEVAKDAPASDLKGRKLASPPQVVALTAGMQISSKQGDAQLARPVTLDTKQLASLAAVSKVQDNTFAKAVILDLSPSGNGMPGGMSDSLAKDIHDGIKGDTDHPPVATFPGEPKPGLPPIGPPNQNAGTRRLKVIVVAQ